MSTEAVDLYAVLGIAPDATAEEVHAAYRRAARRAHPDTGEGSAEEMAQVNRAWASLRDSASRAAYDRARQQPAPPDLAVDPAAGPVAGGGEGPGTMEDGPSRRVLGLLVLGLAMLLAAGLVMALLIGFIEGPGRAA